MGHGGGLKVKGQRSEACSEESAVAKEAHWRLGGGARRTRPLRPAGPAQSRCRLQAERAEHRERAVWGDPAAAGLARRLRSPSPQPLGRAARAALGRWRCTFRSVRRATDLERRRAVGAPGRDPDLSPLPGNGGAAGAEEQAMLDRRVRPRWSGCSGVLAGGSRGRGAAIRPSRPARGRCSPREPELGGRGGGSKAARPEDCHWPEAGGRVGARRDRERAASLVEPRGRAQAALEGCGSARWLPHSAGLHPIDIY